jgi:hypothetical protein
MSTEPRPQVVVVFESLPVLATKVRSAVAEATDDQAKIAAKIDSVANSALLARLAFRQSVISPSDEQYRVPPARV